MRLVLFYGRKHHLIVNLPRGGEVYILVRLLLAETGMDSETRRLPSSQPGPLIDRALGALHFRTFGFVVLRHFFDPSRVASEIDRVVSEGRGVSFEVASGAGIGFQYAPMMTAETPGSLWLLDQTEAVAAALLGGPVIPTRAKGVRYWGNTPWHTDSDLPIVSIGALAYFESLAGNSGALRVLPGSHRPEFASALRALEAVGKPADSLPGHILATEPGDLIIFDEHLFHASSGGDTRRQWRVDYMRDPENDEEEAQVKSYFGELFRPDWDGGYDVDRYPSYGPDWRMSGRACAARLEALGVYELAARQEAYVRSKRGQARETKS